MAMVKPFALDDGRCPPRPNRRSNRDDRRTRYLTRQYQYTVYSNIQARNTQLTIDARVVVTAGTEHSALFGQHHVAEREHLRNILCNENLSHQKYATNKA